ncbi:unnamed protein product [Alternaria burnsii]|nr:unnamed protein product [Alternaria burnsii]
MGIPACIFWTLAMINGFGKAMRWLHRAVFQHLTNRVYVTASDQHTTPCPMTHSLVSVSKTPNTETPEQEQRPRRYC